jgi:predicted GH43/DUF377 family glycosyl hydrolase
MSIGDVRVIADKDYVDTSVVQYISKDDVLDDILENKLVVITDDESGVKQLLFKDKSKIRSGKTYAVLIEEVVAGNPVDTGEVDSEGNPIMEVPTLAGLGINGVSGGTNDSGSNSLIPTEDTAAPIISCNSTATAGTGVVVTISNYDNTKTYTFDKSGGSVSIVSSSGTFIWTMPIVSTNETHTIKVQASDNGSNPSTYSNVASVLVSNLLTLADDSMIFENATIVEDNFESTGGSLEGNTINAGTTIPALPESTNSSLVVESEIVEGQRVQVYYDSGDVERVIGSVTVSGTTNTHDIFGDGSAVATYNLDGNANDLGGNYNGTASNVTYETGKFGQCAVFDGSSGLIPLSNGAIVDVTNDYSISMWIKTTDTVSMNRFFDNVLSNGYLKNQVVIVLYNNDFRVYPISSDGSYTCDGFTFSAPTVENAWMHVVFNIKYDRTYNIYLNGINYAGTDVQNTYITSATTGTTLGKADGDYFNGQIDQVRIFNRALTQEEVTTLYNENVAKYTTPMTLPSKPTKIVTKDNIFESITFNHPLGYNWATNDVKLTLNKPRLNILSESTNLSLVTFNRISNGDKLSLLPEGGLETIDFPIGSVTAEGFGNFSVVTYTGNGSEQHIGTGINSVDFTVPYNGSGYWLARSGKHGVVVPLGASGSTDDVSAYSPTVIKDNGTYKMWYSGNDGSNGRIHYATSTDGINWDKHGVVVPLGASGSTDDYYAFTPTVIKDNGTYKMWYSGHDGSNWRIHYATSTDGINWDKHGVVVPLGASGSTDDFYTEASAVIKDNGTYKMWYSGKDGSNYRTHYATSTDGINWDKHGVVVPLGASGSTDDVHTYTPAVIKDNGTYKMWYAGKNGSNGRIHYATSTDGINWDKHGVVVPLGASGSTDDYYVYTPTVIKDNGTYKMWYSGSDGSSWRTHYAELAGGYSLETHVVTDTGEIQDSGTCGWGPSKGVSKVHIKSRSKVSNHVVFDGLRGVEASISTNLTDAEQTGRTDTLGSFNEDGFTIKHHSDINANQATYVAYQTLYTHIKWGTTNHGKLYIEAYNPATKEGMIYYVGSGTAGHEIPHSMGIEIDLIEGKSLEDGTRPWAIQIPKQNSGRFVYDTDAIASYEHFTPITNSVFTLESGTTSNQNGLEHITYYKCKSETFTIGTYTGTGASGNFIETLDVNGVARKPRRVIIKRVDSANYWVVFDSERDSESLLNKYFRLDSNCVEATYKTFGVKLTNSGFEPNDGDASNNASGGQYLYLVEFETKYTTDISHLNLSEAPTTIFKDPLPKLETSVVADGADKNFEVREVDAVAVDGNNVVIDYSTAAQIGKNGSFRITSDDDTISKLNIDLTREG